MNFYPFHIGDYVTATRHLSWDEDAAYRRLLDVYYTHEKPLPVEERQLFRLVVATTDAQREAVRVVLEEFFRLTPEGWRNERADRELAEMKERQEKAREKANKRWKKPAPTPENAGGGDAEMPQHAEADATAKKICADAMLPTPTPTPTPIPTPIPIPTKHITPLTPLSPGSPDADASAGAESVCCVLDPPVIESDPETRRRGELAALLRNRLVQITPGHPALCQWVNSGITDAEATEAVERAVMQKPPPAMIPAAYLVPIVAVVLAERGERAELAKISREQRREASGRVDNSAVGKVRRAIAERDAARLADEAVLDGQCSRVTH